MVKKYKGFIFTNEESDQNASLKHRAQTSYQMLQLCVCMYEDVWKTQDSQVNGQAILPYVCFMDVFFLKLKRNCNKET